MCFNRIQVTFRQLCIFPLKQIFLATESTSGDVASIVWLFSVKSRKRCLHQFNKKKRREEKRWKKIFKNQRKIQGVPNVSGGYFASAEMTALVPPAQVGVHPPHYPPPFFSPIIVNGRMVGWWWLLVVVVVVDNSRGGREEEGGGLVEGAESVAVTARDLRLQLVGCFISSPFFFFLSLSLPRRRPAVFFSSRRKKNNVKKKHQRGKERNKKGGGGFSPVRGGKLSSRDLPIRRDNTRTISSSAFSSSSSSSSFSSSSFSSFSSFIFFFNVTFYGGKEERERRKEVERGRWRTRWPHTHTHTQKGWNVLERLGRSRNSTTAALFAQISDRLRLFSSVKETPTHLLHVSPEKRQFFVTWTSTADQIWNEKKMDGRKD